MRRFLLLVEYFMCCYCFSWLHQQKAVAELMVRQH